MLDSSQFLKKSYFIIFLKGAVIGLANVIPGVSGGTMALLLGIYEKLIYQIKAFKPNNLKLLLNFKFTAFSKVIDVPFLGFLFLGLVCSIISLAKLLEWLYADYRILTLAFFFGLVMASVFSIWRHLENWSWKEQIFAGLGTLFGAWIVTLDPNTPNPNTIYVFLCGMIAIISMILPGLSGSFVLLIMGNYFLIFKALNNLNLELLFPFILGCITGLLAFSHVLAWLLKHFKDQTLSTLTGFIVASLIILWPWTKPVYVSQTVAGKTKAVLQAYDFYLPELNFELLIAIFVAAIAFSTIIILEKQVGKSTQSSN